MTDSVKGRSVLITGAGRGIGEAAARAFAAAGAHVGLTGRNAARISALADEIGAMALPGDVAVLADVEAAVNRMVEAHGRLDVLINNAAVIDPIGPLHETDPEAWRQLVEINLGGVYHGMRAAIPVMRRQRAGTIISLSSGAAHAPLEGWSGYCSSKAAVAMLTGVADLENRDCGLRIMGLAPGTVATGMQESIRASGINPISRMEWSDHGKPEWVGQTLLWMTTPEAEEFAGKEVALRDPEIMRRVGLTG